MLLSCWSLTSSSDAISCITIEARDAFLDCEVMLEMCMLMFDALEMLEEASPYSRGGSPYFRTATSPLISLHVRLKLIFVLDGTDRGAIADIVDSTKIHDLFQCGLFKLREQVHVRA